MGKVIALISYLVIALAPLLKSIFQSTGQSEAAQAVDEAVSHTTALANALTIIVGALTLLAGGVLHFLPSPLRKKE